MTMTKEEIIQNNILIALFEGYKETGSVHPYNAELGKTYRHKEKAGVLWGERFAYHLSWSWLMPVIEKISRIEYERQEEENGFGEMVTVIETAYPRTFGMLNSEGKPMFRFNRHQLFTAETLIEAAWLAVVDFVNWYNQQSAVNG